MNMDLFQAHRSSPYYDDGSIVLAAASGGSSDALHVYRVYRVHRSVLSEHSVVFHDMFELNSNSLAESHTQETYDGCALVIMQDDSKDLGDLLQMLYNPA